MKNIRTQLFRIGGVWQLGFHGLRTEEIKRFKELRGFRYCGELKIWHITHHSGTLNYLNKRFEGEYYFLSDPTDRKDVVDITPVIRKGQMKIAFYRETGRMIVSHSYHNELYHDIGRLEGAVYDKGNRTWILDFHRQYTALKSLAAKYGMEVTEAEEKAPDRAEVPEKKADVDIEMEVENFRKALFIQNLSERTIESYVSAIKQFLWVFRGRDLQEIRNEEFRDYLYDLSTIKKYSFPTLNAHISAIKTFYKTMFQIQISPIVVPRPKASKQLPKTVSMEEIKKMIQGTANLKHKTIISTLYSTAIRKEELLSIKLEDIDLENKEIRIYGKGDKERIANIPDTLVRLIREYLRGYSPKQYLFEGPKGQYSPSSVYNIVSKAAEKAGIDQRVHPHMMRHSFASHLVSQGTSVVHLQKLLGHSSLKTTLIYTHLSDQDLRNLPNPLDDMGI